MIFDVDGTLLRSTAEDERLYFKAIVSTLGPLPVLKSMSAYHHVTDTGVLLQILEDNEIAPARDLLDRVKTRFEKLIDEHIAVNGPFPEMPGAKDLLNRLSGDRGTCVAIATGGWRSTAVRKLVTAGFGIDGIPMASSDDSYKRTKILSIAHSRLVAPVERTLYVGDAPWDREASAALGWEFLGVGPAVSGVYDLTELQIG